MATKLCPICDSKLDGGCYCKSCRKLVKNPLVLKSDIYLNERHSRNEKDCSFHGEYTVSDSTVSEHVSTGKTVVEDTFHPKNPKKKASKSGISAAAFIVLVIALLQSGLKAGIKKFAADDSMETAVVETDDGWYMSESDSYVEMSDEEAAAMGTRCNGLGHFPFTLEEVKPYFQEAVLSYGYNQADVWEGSYNYTETNQEGQNIYYFNNGWTMHLDSPDNKEVSDILYVSIDADTVTGEVHAIYGYLPTKEDAKRLIGDAVGIIEQSYGSGDSENRITEISDAFDTGMDEEGYFSVTEPYYYVFGGVTEDVYYFNITRLLSFEE